MRDYRRLVVAALILVAGRGAAEMSTEHAASLLYFPRVVARDGADTIIHLSNLSRNARHAYCYYVDGGDGESPSQRVIPFDLFLNRQQPTHWSVSTGRPVDETDAPCAAGLTECEGAGLDPGTIPAVAPFSGSLICIEVDASGFPVPGNALQGRTTVQESDGSVSGYGAVGLNGFDTNNMDYTLCLGGDVAADCPAGAEYEACPDTWILTHPSQESTDPMIGGASTQRTVLSIAPCGVDLKSRQPENLNLQFKVTNEFEELFSASTTVPAWHDQSLDATISTVFERNAIGTDLVYTTIQASSGSPPFVLVARTLVQVSPSSPPVETATNLRAIGNATGRRIQLPPPREDAR